jgi:hypothetical protein
MAENIGALILPIGADASQFNRSINDVKAAFKELSNTIASTPFNLVTDKQKLELNALQETLKILTTDVKEFGKALQFPENSILGLKQRIQELNDEKIRLDPTTSATKIAKLNQEIEKLEEKLQNVDKLGKKVGDSSGGFSKGADNISEQAKKAGRALTSLSLVAQDLPFGFIAIQNNLPALLQTFGALDTKSNGLKGAFKELSGALVGPAGLFLAYSAVTAAVTYAIKQYGSFELALKSLFGTVSSLDLIQKRATESLKEYNDEIVTTGEITGDASAKVADQIFRLETLTGIVKDNTLSENQRANALKEIQKLDPERLKSLSLQKKGYQDLDEWVKIYTDSLIANAVAQEYLSKVVATTTQINQQANLLAEISKGYIDIAKRRREAEGQQIFDPLTGADLTTTILGGLQTAEENLNKDFKEQKVIVDGLWKTLDQYKKSAADATKEAIKFFRETKDGKGDKNQFTLSIESQDLDAAFNLEKIKSNVEKLGNVILDTNKSVEERKNALKELIAINPQLFSGLTLEKSGLTNLKTTVEAYTRSLQILIKEREFDARVSQINTQLRNAEIKKTEDAVKVSNDKVKSYEDQFENIVRLTYAQDQYGNSTDKITDKSLSFLKVLKQQQDISAAINKALNNIYGPGTAEENDPVKRVEELSKRIKQAKDNFENTIRRGLQQPFEDFFSTLIETGKFSLDSFEGLFKDMLKRIAAQIVSAGIAKLISSILFPPSAAAGALAGAAAGKQSGGIIDALISLFGGRRAFNNVNFGGIEGGGMQMSGQVVFVQRGSDLVGVLNRTNGTINRVG